MTDQPNQTTLYQKLVAMGATIDSHASDLYVKWTPDVSAVVGLSGKTYSTFKSNIDSETWIDIPFAYDPFWENKLKQQPEAKAADLPTMLTMFGLAPELLKEPQPAATVAPLVFQLATPAKDEHAPAPWEIVRHFDRIESIGPISANASANDDTDLVAWLDVTEADARLAAAAPELLEVVQTYLHDLEHPGSPLTKAGRNHRLNQCRRIIAKATGNAQA